MADAMRKDGLTDPLLSGVAMGMHAEKAAADFDISRQAQDEFVLRPLTATHTLMLRSQFDDAGTPHFRTVARSKRPNRENLGAR